VSESDATGPISQTLWDSWMEWQKANLYATWRRDNPGEDDKLRRYWNHGGDIPQLATATGKAYVLEAEGYWQAVSVEAKSYAAPLAQAGTKVLVAPEAHPKDWNGWPAFDLKTKKGEPVYAVADGKIPHSYPDDVDGGMPGAHKSAFDGKDGLRWGYAHIIVTTMDRQEFKRGAQLGTAASDQIHFCCQNQVELCRAVYT
jgi:hypothetical protein